MICFFLQPEAMNQGFVDRIPWFVKQWRVPLNRCIYTAFSYMIFLLYIILYVAEVQPPLITWIDALTAVWIISYTFRDMGTGMTGHKQTICSLDRVPSICLHCSLLPLEVGEP